MQIGPSSLDIEALFLWIYNLIRNGEFGLPGIFYDIRIIVSVLASILVPLFIVGIIYVLIRTMQIQSREAAAYNAKAQITAGAQRENERWERVNNLALSDNPSDWRQAIIEADVMLDDALRDRGYLGETLGERLKSIAPGDMRTLNQAWEAHKIRNQIAHAGSDFILSQRETRRAVDLFQRVFEEFDFV